MGYERIGEYRGLNGKLCVERATASEIIMAAESCEAEEVREEAAGRVQQCRIAMHVEVAERGLDVG